MEGLSGVKVSQNLASYTNDPSVSENKHLYRMCDIILFNKLNDDTHEIASSLGKNK